MPGIGPRQDLRGGEFRGGSAKLLAAVLLEESGEGRTAGKPSSAGGKCVLDRTPCIAWRFANRAGLVVGPSTFASEERVGPLEYLRRPKRRSIARHSDSATFHQQPCQRRAARERPTAHAQCAIHAKPGDTAATGDGSRNVRRPVTRLRVPGVRPFQDLRNRPGRPAVAAFLLSLEPCSQLAALCSICVGHGNEVFAYTHCNEFRVTGPRWRAGHVSSVLLIGRRRSRHKKRA